MARVLTGRQRKNKKYQDEYNNSFLNNLASPNRKKDQDSNIMGVGLHRTAADYMMTNSLIENEQTQENAQDTHQDEGKKHLEDSGGKSNFD